MRDLIGFIIIIVVSIVLFHYYVIVDYSIEINNFVVYGGDRSVSQLLMYVTEGTKLSIYIYNNAEFPISNIIYINDKNISEVASPGSRISVGPYIIYDNNFINITVISYSYGYSGFNRSSVGLVDIIVAVSGGSRIPYVVYYGATLLLASIPFILLIRTVSVRRGWWSPLFPALILTWVLGLLLIVSWIKDYFIPAYAVVLPPGQECFLSLWLKPILDRANLIVDSGVLVVGLFVGVLSVLVDKSFKYHYFYSFIGSYRFRDFFLRLAFVFAVLLYVYFVVLLSVIVGLRLYRLIVFSDMTLEIKDIIPLVFSIFVSMFLIIFVSGLLTLVVENPLVAALGLMVVSYLVEGRTIIRMIYGECASLLNLWVSQMGKIYIVLFLILFVLLFLKWLKR